MDTFENIIRDKLNDYQYTHSEFLWHKLEKNLTNSVSQTQNTKLLTKLFYYTVGAVIIGGGLYIYTDFIKTNPIQQTQSILKNNKLTNTTIPKTISESTTSINTTNKLNNNDEKKSVVLYPPNSTLNTTNNIYSSISTEKNTKKSNNTIINETNDNIKTPYESTPLKEETNILKADFLVSVNEGCVPLKIKFIPILKSDKIIYSWDFGDGTNSTDMEPYHTYSIAGEYTPTLTVKHYYSEEIITKTLSYSILVKPKYDVTITTQIENNTVYFYPQTNQKITKLLWNFGDGSMSEESNPQHIYYREGTYNVKLISINEFDCADTSSINVSIQIEHTYFVPEAFTPNDDNNNDFFGPIGVNFSNYIYSMNIFDNKGQLVFNTTNYNNQWNGRILGTKQKAEEGTYYYIITTIDEYGNKKIRTGAVILKY